MPYIKLDDRKHFDPWINQIINTAKQITDVTPIDYAGMFTYVIYRLLKELFSGRFWLRALGIGCMVCAILEIYRRDHSEYEDQKIKEHGDIE